MKLQIVKKAGMETKQAIILRSAAVLLSLVFAALVIFIFGYNPIKIYAKMIEGSFFTPFRIQETIHKAIPLIILSLGVSVAFRMKFWNIGAEGQFYMGAVAASWVALNFGDLPMLVLIPLMFIVAFIAGGLWSLVPAFLKIKCGASETLVTLMMNYIAIKFVTYLQIGPWKDPNAGGFAKIAKFTSNAVIPKVGGVHLGWIIALALAALVYFLIKYTKLGYEISVLGENMDTARYAGMNVAKIIILAVLISGGICGIAGMIQASAVERSLSDQLSAGLGFTAVITAWLSQLSAPVIVIVSFLFSVMLQGGAYIQTALQVPAAVAEIIQGIILFFVLGSEFFMQYKIVVHKNDKEAAK
nr:ABC transporter permease [Clostridia bacterium]